MPQDYDAFLASKHMSVTATGIAVQDSDIHPMLFPFQRDLVRWACHKGRCAVWADTGLGKTLIQLEVARLWGKRTLIIAPLSVARQTVREGRKIGVDVRYVRSQSEIDGEHLLWITNYDMIDHFDMTAFDAVILDESSILKSLDGKTRKRLVEMCDSVPWRLCCTATPAPNDYIELGNHAEFLGICSMQEMLAMFFINANKDHTFIMGDRAYTKKGTNKGGTEWRLKHHAEDSFFRWLSSWAIALMHPSDLGYDDDGFILPPLTVDPVFVPTTYVPDGQVVFTHLRGIGDRSTVRRETIEAKIDIMRNLIDTSDGQWIVWVGLDAESHAVTQALTGAVEVQGSDDPESKAQAFEDFQDGHYRILVTKSKIGGFGMNFQNAHNMLFFGINDSWESYYQAIRREWRFGQKEPVNVYIVLADVESEVYENVLRKDAQAARLRQKMIASVRGYEMDELLQRQEANAEPYDEQTAAGDGWTAYRGDSCVVLPRLAADSIDLSVYSPPFADLFTYSASDRDLGNSHDWPQFFEHYAFIIREMLRVTKPGRLTCVHTSDIPAMMQKDEYVGVRDFPGAVIAAYEREGWIFWGRILVQKNPQAQAIRTHATGLLFVQMERDSSKSRPALVDHVLLFKKPGDNAVPVRPMQNGEMTRDRWIEWANGIWTDIRETETLQYAHAKGNDDKHICPLQLGTIERCIKLWSNPGEMVLTPFGGIGSEGYMAVKLGRQATLIELKESYFRVLCDNMRTAEVMTQSLPLFALDVQLPLDA